MTSSPHDFEPLRKLLKLKHHEVPPPGYFNSFSCRVISRLETSPQPGWFSRLEDGLPWLGGLRSMLSQNPLAAGVFAVCGLLVLAVSTSHYLDQSPGASPELATAFMPAVGLAPQGTGSSGQLAWLAQSPGVQFRSSAISPVLATNIPGSLFSPFDFAAPPVSYPIPQY